MSERYRGDVSDDERQRRLDALRSIARQSEQLSDPHLPAAPTAPLSDERAGSPTARRLSRRGRVALVIVAGLIIVGMVASALLRQSGGASVGQRVAQPPLVAKTFSMTSEAGIYCASTPAWSPDSTQFAVFGQTNPQTDSCMPYNPQTAIAQLSGGSVAYQSSNQAEGYTLAIFDAASGHALQRMALPALSKALCAADPCGIADPSLQSLSWSPDGRSIAVFFTYTLETYFDPIGHPLFAQQSGGLIIARVGSADATRIVTAQAPRQTISGASALPSAPRFTWNFVTGAATISAPPDAQSIDTTAYAPAYQWTADGQLNALTTAPALNAITPWRSGAIGQRHNATDPARFLSSQWLWSPDGKYVTPNLNTSAYVNLPGVASATAASGGYTPPLATAPDAATVAAIQAAQTSRGGVELARSPDGKLLASFTCAPNDTGLLTLRATKSDTPLAQASYAFPSTVYSLGCAGDIGDIVWSPDSASIAIADEQDAQVTIWRVNVAH